MLEVGHGPDPAAGSTLLSVQHRTINEPSKCMSMYVNTFTYMYKMHKVYICMYIYISLHYVYVYVYTY